MAADYDASGYCLIDRKTRELHRIDEATVDNRGCFDIRAVPNFSEADFPFVLTKARKAVSLLNI